MNFFRDIDIENLKLRAGYGTGDVVLTREEFEILVEGYHRVYVSQDDAQLGGRGFKVGERFRALQDRVTELEKELEKHVPKDLFR